MRTLTPLPQPQPTQERGSRPSRLTSRQSGRLARPAASRPLEANGHGARGCSAAALSTHARSGGGSQVARASACRHATLAAPTRTVSQAACLRARAGPRLICAWSQCSPTTSLSRTLCSHAPPAPAAMRRRGGGRACGRRCCLRTAGWCPASSSSGGDDDGGSVCVSGGAGERRPAGLGCMGTWVWVSCAGAWWCEHAKERAACPPSSQPALMSKSSCRRAGHL